MYSAGAEYDLNAIFAYLRLKAHSTTVRNRLLDIEHALERIRDMPLSGRLQQGGRIRKVLSSRHRYRIFYYMRNAKTVVIITIQDPARNTDFEDA
ncbi:type II toxin-antitoxin system RelE/ParE family toxin [Lichenihabitans sp. Uapishka_5]|uniref:type II toxin-antitoxin system RelE/ParE family toxin n=1 Tax=Lichenihabitans sp. Uapishka_5 TaxID=3037302 RepID=UPI003FA5A0BD